MAVFLEFHCFEKSGYLRTMCSGCVYLEADCNLAELGSGRGGSERRQKHQAEGNPMTPVEVGNFSCSIGFDGVISLIPASFLPPSCIQTHLGNR